MISDNLPTTRDSGYIWWCIAHKMITSYCYKNGINPDTLITTYIDGRFEDQVVLRKWFIWIWKKTKDMIFQKIFVFVKDKLKDHWNNNS